MKHWHLIYRLMDQHYLDFNQLRLYLFNPVIDQALTSDQPWYEPSIDIESILLWTKWLYPFNPGMDQTLTSNHPAMDQMDTSSHTAMDQTYTSNNTAMDQIDTSSHTKMDQTYTSNHTAMDETYTSILPCYGNGNTQAILLIDQAVTYIQP